MKKQNKTAKKNSNAKSTATAEKAIVLALDVKQNHSMRKRLEGEGIDAMALHSFDKISKGYVEQCAALAKVGKEIVGESVTLICNGVTERISTEAKSGNYSRKVGNGKLLFGNVVSLRSLYGEQVETVTDEAVTARFKAGKEIVKRKLGDGREISGKVIAQGKKGEMTLDVVAVELGAGKFGLHNLEDKTNTHQRKVNRWQALQVKAEKVTATASK